eukprot:Rhum_TRINITY_DN15003_c2_g5::Rhum_TRINITY_DN15003_c2_g5_i2::g.133085::m.133085
MSPQGCAPHAARLLLLFFFLSLLPSDASAVKRVKKWRFEAPLKRWTWEGVDHELYGRVKAEARGLFGRLFDLNASVEVTGHIWMFPDQASFYQRQVQDMLPGQRLCEVGFGSGLSSLGYLRSNPNISLLTFDLWEDKRARWGDGDEYLKRRKEMGYEHLMKFFSNRWTLVKGDAKVTIPRYAAMHGNTMCDVIHIDGEHTRGGILSDLMYFQTLAKPLHTVLVDDLQFDDLQKGLRDFNDAIRLMDCYTTDKRDVKFTGPGRRKKSTKWWCRLEYNVSWSAETSPGFPDYFTTLTNRTIPDVIMPGNRYKNVNVTLLRHQRARGLAENLPMLRPAWDRSRPPEANASSSFLQFSSQGGANDTSWLPPAALQWAGGAADHDTHVILPLCVAFALLFGTLLRCLKRRRAGRTASIRTSNISNSP